MIQLTWIRSTCYTQPSSWPDLDVHAFKVKPLLAFCTLGHSAIICLWKTTSAVQLDDYLFGITSVDCCRIFRLRKSAERFSFKTVLNVWTHLLWVIRYIFRTLRLCSIVCICNAENTTVHFSFLLLYRLNVNFEFVVYRKLIAIYLS